MDAKADLAKLALDYHAYPTPGKISVVPTKTLGNQDDLSLAYSPGVASACMAIFDEGEEAAAKYTSRANLVGVITNGTAVLGLGNIGPLASKPVMEGKGCLFKSLLVSMSLTLSLPRPTRRSLSISLPPWSRLLVESTSKTLKPPSAFISSKNFVNA